MGAMTSRMTHRVLLGCFARSSSRIEFPTQMPVIVAIASAVTIARRGRIVTPLIIPAAGSPVDFRAVRFGSRVYGSRFGCGLSRGRIQRATGIEIRTVHVFAVDSQHHHTRLVRGWGSIRHVFHAISIAPFVHFSRMGRKRIQQKQDACTQHKDNLPVHLTTPVHLTKSGHIQIEN
jgi:hypothetical protein